MLVLTKFCRKPESSLPFSDENTATELWNLKLVKAVHRN